MENLRNHRSERNRTVGIVIGIGLLWMAGIAVSTVLFRDPFQWWRPAIVAGVGILFFGVWICAWRASRNRSGG